MPSSTLQGSYASSRGFSPSSPSEVPPAVVLGRLSAATAIPRRSPAEWLRVLRAPHGHVNTRKDYAARAVEATMCLSEPAVMGLAHWVADVWPGSLAALAGALSVVPDLQAAATRGWVDPSWATNRLYEAATEARSALRQTPRVSSRSRGRAVLGGVDFDSLASVDADPSSSEAAQWAQTVTGWVDRQVGAGRRSLDALLVVESNLPGFWAWYAKRVDASGVGSRLAESRLDGACEAAPTVFPPPPPTRALGSAQRLVDCLSAGRSRPGSSISECSRLLLGPPRRRQWAPDRGWHMGVGYWSLIALRSWAAKADPPNPPAVVLRWWSSTMDTISRLPAPWELDVDSSAGVRAA